MTKLNPLALIALCVVAIAILAFTINDQLGKGKKKVSGVTLVSKNSNIFTPSIAYNPPHGEPGHNHDLPDGAPLTNNATDVPLNTPLAHPSIEPATTTALNPPHGEQGHKCGIAVGAPLTSTPVDSIAPSTGKTSAAPGKNPAHGQPGHKCDIAVGAPLNSTPVQPTTTNTTTSNTTTAPANTNKTVSATGLNPAHGQPGHRCDIAVGAPLNSPAKSAATTTTTTSTIPSTKNNSLNPAIFPNYNFPKTDSVSSAAPQLQYDSTGAALNPAHGQPGHDCSIGVGKPLKK